MSYKTKDYGKTWSPINTGIQQDDFIKVIREDKKVKDILYAGAERGFYISFNGGANWHNLQLNLPLVPVTDIAFADNDMVISTAGRAFWILDDLSALQQSKGKFDGLKIFEPKPTYKYEGYIPSWMDLPPGIGKNPATGVILDYYLPESADSLELRLEILNESGKVVRSYSNRKDENFKSFPGGPSPDPVIPSEKGVNRFAWDFRGKTLLEIPNAFVYGDYSGHRLAPGKYTARLTFQDVSSETPFEVVQDPNLKNVETKDWATQQQFLEKTEVLLTEIHTAVNDMRKVKSQIEHHNNLLKDWEDSKDLVASGEELIKKLTEWENKIVETRQSNFQDVINFPSQLNAQFFELRAAVDVHDPRLTDAVKSRLSELEADWASFKNELNTLIQHDIPAYNEKYKTKNIPAIINN
jgi:hypothetical protein